MSASDTKARAVGQAGQASADPAALAATLARDLAQLAALPLDQLRVQFRNRTGRIAPARISRPLLLRVLAYRLQADLFGDLRPETRRMLERAGVGRAEPAEAGGRAALAAAEARMRPRTGTVLVREWQGRLERVSVGEASYSWNGSSYASLSAVATAITGTKWNGRRFFGLDQAPAKLGRASARSAVVSQAAAEGARP